MTIHSSPKLHVYPQYAVAWKTSKIAPGDLVVSPGVTCYAWRDFYQSPVFNPPCSIESSDQPMIVISILECVDTGVKFSLPPSLCQPEHDMLVYVVLTQHGLLCVPMLR